MVLRVRDQVRGRRERPGRILMMSLAPLMVMDVAGMVPVPVIVPAAAAGGRHGHPVVSLSEDDKVVRRRLKSWILGL